MKTSRKHFTLMEILVAVAVLVLMMTFLFQFAIGAQRFWSGTTGRNEIAADADTIFSIMQGDFEEMYVSNKAPVTATWLCDKRNADAEDEDNLCFFTFNSKTKKLMAVRYRLLQNNDATDDDKKMFGFYRYTSEDIAASPVEVWDKLGAATDPTADNYVTAPAIPTDRADLRKTDNDNFDYELSSNVVSWRITTKEAPGTDGTTNPVFVKVTLKLRVPAELRRSEDDDSGDRVFSRIFFIKQN